MALITAELPLLERLALKLDFDASSSYPHSCGDSQPQSFSTSTMSQYLLGILEPHRPADQWHLDVVGRDRNDHAYDAEFATL